MKRMKKNDLRPEFFLTEKASTKMYTKTSMSFNQD